jgi:hypothetical protein
MALSGSHQVNLRLQWCPDQFLASAHFQPTLHNSSDIQQPFPSLRQLVVRPLLI